MCARRRTSGRQAQGALREVLTSVRLALSLTAVPAVHLSSGRRQSALIDEYEAGRVNQGALRPEEHFTVSSISADVCDVPCGGADVAHLWHAGGAHDLRGDAVTARAGEAALEGDCGESWPLRRRRGGLGGCAELHARCALFTRRRPG